MSAPAPAVYPATDRLTPEFLERTAAKCIATADRHDAAGLRDLAASQREYAARSRATAAAMRRGALR